MLTVLIVVALRYCAVHLLGELPDKPMPPAAEPPPEPGSPWDSRFWDVVILALLVMIVYLITLESA